MSHSRVCNTTVSTKKTRPTLAKHVRKLRVTLHACKGNVPVSVKNEYATSSMYVWACNKEYAVMCMCV